MSLTVQAQDLAATRAELIEQSQRSRAGGDHSTALSLALRASTIAPGLTPSLRALIAVEQLALNQFADAYNSGVGCLREFRQNTTLADRETYTAACTQVIERAQVHVGRIVVMVSGQPSELHVRIAGQEIPAAVIGIPYIVNPGLVHVEAELDGQVFFRRVVNVAEGSTNNVTMTIPPRRIVVRTQQEVRPVSPAPIIILGAGGLGFITVGIVGAFQQSALTQLRAACDPQTTPDELNCFDRASTRQNIANVDTFTTATNVMIGVSTAITLAGTVWLVIDRLNATSSRPTRVQLAPSIGGLSFQGRW